MVSHKSFKSCGIISRILNTLDIKSKKMIYYNLIHPYLIYCINVWSSTCRSNFKTLCTAQKRSVRTLFDTAQQPHSRDIFINQKILPLDKLIDQQEGILAYKIINGHICWTTFSIMELLGIKSNLKTLVTWGYRYMHQLNLNSLFALE